MFINSIGAYLSPKAPQTFLKCLKLPSISTYMYLFSICLTLVRQLLGFKLTTSCTLLPLSYSLSASSYLVLAKLVCNFNKLSMKRAMYSSLTRRSTGLAIWSISLIANSSLIWSITYSIIGDFRVTVGRLEKLCLFLFGEGWTLMELILVNYLDKVGP